MLIYFYIGYLDWSELKIIDEIVILKQAVVTNNKYPRILLNYMKYVKSLEFEEAPNYSIIIDDFKREIDLLV